MSAKRPEDYLAQPYSRVLIPDKDGKFAAEILEFPGCFASGSNPDEAFSNLEEVAKEWIESEIEYGREIPEPFTNYGFSGKIALRLPRSLHKKATIFAARDRVSLNQFLVSAIAARVGAQDLKINIDISPPDRISFSLFDRQSHSEQEEVRVPEEGVIRSVSSETTAPEDVILRPLVLSESVLHT